MDGETEQMDTETPTIEATKRNGPEANNKTESKENVPRETVEEGTKDEKTEQIDEAERKKIRYVKVPLTTVDKVRKLIEEHLLPFSNPDEIREIRDLLKNETQLIHLYEAYCPTLYKNYIRYCGEDKEDFKSNHSESMNLNEFHKFCRDFKLLDRKLTKRKGKGCMHVMCEPCFMYAWVPFYECNIDLYVQTSCLIRAHFTCSQRIQVRSLNVSYYLSLSIMQLQYECKLYVLLRIQLPRSSAWGKMMMRAFGV